MTSTTGVTIIAAGDIKLAMREWGTGEPPLVLLHGYTGSSLDWADVAPRLAESRHVVAYDHRGHGDSDHAPATSYTLEALAGDLAAFLAGHASAPVDLLGHSMGGVVALRHTLAHPATVRSLVLMDTAAEPSGPIDTEMLGTLVAIGRAQGMDAVAQLVGDFVASAAPAGTVPAEVARERAVAKFSGLDVEALAAFAAELQGYPSMADDLARITCPVTVIVGENDDGLRAAADLMTARIPAARLVVIPGAGHSPQEDCPDEWVSAVRAHLDCLHDEVTDGD